jgi:DNA-directed RNA polymerase specialized sigma24 family protein
MRNVMLLRDIKGLPMRDVADELGISVSAAKSRSSGLAPNYARMVRQLTAYEPSPLSQRAPLTE